MSALPSEAYNALTQLVSSLTSGDNTIRKDAEKVLETHWTLPENVEVLLVFLAEQSIGGENETVKAFSAVLFRRIANRTPPSMGIRHTTIGVISEPVRAQIKQTLLQGFSTQQSNTLRHKISDAISEVARSQEWPELLPALFEAAKNQDPSLRESSFRIFAAVPETVGAKHINEIIPIFSAGFEDTSDEVRVAACNAFVAFFKDLDKRFWQQLAPLLPALLSELPPFLENGQESALESVLEDLIDLVELAPKMFKDMFIQVIEFCSAIAKNKDLEGSTRISALELLTSFSESAPSMCKKTGLYAEAMVTNTLSMLTEVSPDDDAAAEWNNRDIDDEGDEEEDEPEYDSARQALDRVALRLGGQSLAQPLFTYLPAMIQSDDWRQRQAALMAISAAAEGCADVLMNEIPKLLDMILPTLQDPHPRVQYACCNALGQMCTDFADVIQRTSGARILPALISMLTTKSVFRVQSHAAAALVNFSEAATKEVLEPYLDDLLTNLLGLLNSPKRYVQGQVLITIAIIADAAETKFIKYYDTLMPLLINVLKSDTTDEHRTIKANCIECSTLIAVAVGREKFLPQSQELITLFAQLQQQEMTDDDPVKPHLEVAWGRICRIIGKDFLPILPNVLPPLLKSAKATQDISLLEEDEAEEYQQNEEWEVINLSGKLIAVHTSSLDDKVRSMDILRTYAIQLRGDFFPWVQEIIQDIGIPALDFYLHDGVRAAAALTLAASLRCSVAATGQNSQETLAFWSQIVNKLVEVLTNEPVPELLVAYYTAIVECVNAIGSSAISQQQLEQLSIAINTNLKEIYDRIKARDNEDDEYTEDVDEEEEEYTDEELLDEINKAISALFKNTKTQFLAVFGNLAPTIASFIHDENTSIKLCGLCVVCDILEHCGGESINYKDMFAQTMFESLTSSHAGIRQAASYGVGLVAQHGGEGNGNNPYGEFCLTCLEPMFKMTQVPDARAEENVSATENAVGSIAKICHAFASQIPNLDAILTQWVGLLPIVQDDEVAPYAYMFLSELIKNEHPSITQQLPKAVDSVIQALSHGSIGGATAERVVAATKQLLTKLPQPEYMSLLSKYPAEVQVVIQKWFA